MRGWPAVALGVVCACGSASSSGSGSGSAAPPQGDGGTGGSVADGGTGGSIADAGTDAGTAQLPSVDPFKELLVVDSSVVLDARASNATDGAWSFRHTVEQLAGSAAPAFVERWLRTFRGAAVAGRAVDDRPGVDALLASWPRTSDGALDLSRAPFRLVAIAGRLDLLTAPRGEGRLVYGLVDPVTRQPGLFTVAFEYALPALETPNDRQAWAARFHSLGSRPFGDSYNQALQAITDAFATPAALAQVRTNEAAFGSPWELREWKLADGQLAPAWTAQNPDQSLDGSQALSQFVRDHAADVRAGTMQLPQSMLAGTSLETGAWRFPNDPAIDEPLRHAFAMQTCNGCHATETFSAQGFFHVNPLRPIDPGGDGHDRLSQFLLSSELPRRANHLAQLVAGTASTGLGAPTDLSALPSNLPAYDVTEIPAPEDSAPVALSNGRVLGNSAANGPWLYDGTVHFLLPGDARKPIVQGFNARGDIVGYFAAGGPRAFVISGGATTSFGTLGGGESIASLVSDGGLVAGESTVSSGTHHGFVVSGGALSDIGGLGGGETFPFAISPSGLVTGESQLNASVFKSHAFVWSASASMKDLGTLGGNYSRGQTIDDAGLVTGFSTLVPSDEKVHAFVFENGAMVDLGAAPGLPWSAVTGRNSSGVMVGNIYDVPSPDAQIFTIHSFIDTGSGIVDLNRIVSSPRTLGATLGIDDQGRILCTDGQVGARTAHALLLIPR